MTQTGPASFQEPVFFSMINWRQLPRKQGASGMEEEYSDPVGRGYSALGIRRILWF